MDFYSKEISYTPYSTFLICAICSKGFDSSLIPLHIKTCFINSESPTYEYQKNSKKLIDQKLSFRLKKLEILKNLLKNDQHFHSDSILSYTIQKIEKIFQKSSNIIKKTFFTKDEANYIENRVLFQRLIINYQASSLKDILIWESPKFKSSSLNFKFLHLTLGQKPIKNEINISKLSTL